MQGDGNLVLYDMTTGAVTWMSNTPGFNNVKAVMQNDGNLVLYDYNNYVPWMSGTNPVASAQLVVQDDGNLAIYGWSPVWQTGTVMGDCGATLPTGGSKPLLQRISAPPASNFDNAGSPNVLSVGQKITSANGCYSLVLQGDLNLVLYRNTDGYVPWASWTQGNAYNYSAKLVVQSDGNLVLYNGYGAVPWMTNTPTGWGRQLIMQNDGNLVLYTDRVLVWQKGNKYTYWAKNQGGGSGSNLCIGVQYDSSTGWHFGCP
jgi:hypothetical protein